MDPSHDHQSSPSHQYPTISSEAAGLVMIDHLPGLSKKEQEESSGAGCCIMDAVWYVIFRFCR